MRRVGRIFPPLLVRVVLAQASVHARIPLADRVLLLAAGQERPRVRALPAIDLIPTSAVDRERLLQVANPQLTS